MALYKFKAINIYILITIKFISKAVDSKISEHYNYLNTLIFMYNKERNL